MAYNYGFSPFQNNYRGSSDYKSRRSFSRSGGRGYSASNGKPRSGCKAVPGRKDPSVIYIVGWKVGRAGFRKFIAGPPKGGAKVRPGKTGIQWNSCSVTVENVTMMTKTTFPGWIDPTTKRVFVKELNLLMNPQTGRITQFQKNKR